MSHLLVLSGKLGRHAHVATVMQQLLGRNPGGLPGEEAPSPPPAGELSPAASVAYMAAWVTARGGTERRRA